MSTVEQTAPDASVTYDGFISYSHSADDLLAPRLQAGLQRFAKPWWKRRAVRVFRDESSLAANPHLWSSITEALDASGWFVLLLSPDAAGSEWVGKEIEHWKANQPADRILPVVTDGDFGWSDGDVVGSSVPPALRGVFAEEPRWVDLRFARGEETLDLKNPAFAAAIADVASSIRGVPKDELASEEVRQHRRTIRTAWTGAAVVVSLAVAAGGFGIQASRNADLARANAEAEAEARQDADAQRQVAEANAVAEATARSDADANARLAQARELAASAIAVVDTDPRLATHLALAAIDATPDGQNQPVEVINALWRAAGADALEAEVAHGFGGTTFVDISPDGRSLAISSAAGASLELRDSVSFDVLWTYSEPTQDAFARPKFSPDGALIAIDVVGSESGSPWAQQGTDTVPNRVIIIEAASGGVVKTLEFPDCDGVWAPAWSPQGDLLAVSTAFLAECPRPEVSETKWIEVFDTGSWASVAVIGMIGDDNGVSALFLSQDRLGAFRILNPLEVYDTSTFQLIEVLEEVKNPITPAVSISSGRIASHSNADLRGYMYDLETGAQLDILGDLEAWPEIPYGASFSGDGASIAFATAGRILIWDVTSGEQTHVLNAGVGSLNAVFSPDGSRLYSAHQDGVVRVWNLTARSSIFDQIETFPKGSFVNGNSFSIGSKIGSVMRFEFEPEFKLFIEFFSTRTGELTAPALLGDSNPIMLPEDRLVVRLQGAEAFSVYDPESGRSQPVGPACSEDLACSLPTISVDQTEFALVYELTNGSLNWVFFDSANRQQTESRTYPGALSTPWGFGASWVLQSEGFTAYVVRDRDTGDELLRLPMDPRGYAPSDDGRTIALKGLDGPITLVDTASWEVEILDLGFGRMRGFSFNPSGSLLAVADEDEVLIVDVAGSEIVQEVPFALVSDIHWMSDTEILIGDRDGTLWGTLSLDTDQLIKFVREAVIDRPLSLQECATYRIDPCPTAEEGE